MRRVRTIVGFLLALAVLTAAAFALRPIVDRVWFLYRLSTEPPPPHLPSPIADLRARRFVNSWGASRSGGRRHEGIDIFAPKDTPVRSTTRGIVTRVGTNTLGGQIVMVLGPGLEWHYYAHLDRYGAFHVGDVVQPGDVIGYVGNTGNARGTPYHLHYGIYRNGGAENPYPRLTGSGNAGVLSPHHSAE